MTIGIKFNTKVSIQFVQHMNDMAI